MCFTVCVSSGNCNSIIKVLQYEMIQRFMGKFESHLFKLSLKKKAFLFIFYLLLIFYFFPSYMVNINKYKKNIKYNNVTKLKFLWKKVK